MRPYTIILSLTLLVSATFMARSQVPRYISYQGLYTDTLGVPRPDGDYRFTFRFYPDSVGGSILFPPEVRVLKVKRGLFSVLLGGQPGFDAVFSGPRWMSLQVDPDPEISRRIPLASTAYSFRSIRSDTAQFALNAPLQQSADSARIAGTVANNAITSAKILDGTIQSVDVATGFKSPDAFIADTVRRSPPTVVAPGSIDSVKLATNAVATSRIVNGAVTAAKIASGQVVKGLNDVRDMVRIVGRRNATVNTSNDTLYIDAITGTTDTTGVRAIQNTNNTLDVTTSVDRIATINVKDQGIRTVQLADGAVTQVKLAANVTLPPGGPASGDLTGTYPGPTIAGSAVTTPKIADGAVTQTKFAPGVSLPPSGGAGGDLSGTYPNPTIGPNAITTGKILDGTIIRADVAPGFKAPDADIADTVRRAPLAVVAPGSIDSTKLATNAVVTTRILNGAVTAAKIAAGQIVKGVNDLKDNIRLVGRGAASITSSNDTIYIETPPPTGGTGIQSLSNTNNTLTIVNPNGPNAIANVKDASIGPVQLADAGVTQQKIADGAVGTFKIADGAVTQAKIAATVTFPPGGPAGGDLAGTYPNPNIAPNAVTTGKILDGAVTQSKIAGGVTLPPTGQAGGDLAGTYPNPTLAPSTVTTARIADGAVTQAKIAPGVSLPPGGNAGGDLSGTYPNPTLSATGVTPGTYGSNTAVSQIIVDAKGRIASAGSVNISGVPPGGTAAGDLTGAYPSPAIAANAVTTGKIADGTILFQDIAQNGAAPGQVMKWTGTAWAPRADSLGSGGGVGGTGGAGQVAFWNSSSSIASTSFFIWDNQNARLGIGVPIPQERLDVGGTIALRNMPFGSGNTVAVDSSGRLVRPGSSKRFKTNIRPLEPTHVLDLKPVRFQWKSTGEEDTGLIAEEVNEVCPELVVMYDGKPSGVKYDKVAVFLLDVIKEQQKQIAELQVSVKLLMDNNKSSVGDLK